MSWFPHALQYFGLLIALIGLVRTFISGGRAKAEALSKQQAQQDERISLLEMKIGMFWRLVEEHLSTMLKKPTHLEMDALLDKLKAHTLGLEEAYVLRTWLQQVYLEPQRTPTQERLIAILVLGAVDSLIHELERAQ